MAPRSRTGLTSRPPPSSSKGLTDNCLTGAFFSTCHRLTCLWCAMLETRAPDLGLIFFTLGLSAGPGRPRRPLGVSRILPNGTTGRQTRAGGADPCRSAAWNTLRLGADSERLNPPGHQPSPSQECPQLACVCVSHRDPGTVRSPPARVHRIAGIRSPPRTFSCLGGKMA